MSNLERKYKYLQHSQSSSEIKRLTEPDIIFQCPVPLAWIKAVTPVRKSAQVSVHNQINPWIINVPLQSGATRHWGKVVRENELKLEFYSWLS